MERAVALAKTQLGLAAARAPQPPQFIAYSVKDLPAVAPLLARAAFGLPLLVWTVRSEDDRRLAARWADQMIFEGWRPPAKGR